jgi:GxxExxY protein
MLVPTPHNETTRAIIGAAIDVHRALGPGLLESIYMRCLEFELRQRDLKFTREVSIPITYKSEDLGAHYRVDLIVEDVVVVEVKSVAVVLPVHRAQVLTYLRLTGCPIGLILNFNEGTLVEGVHRVMNQD